LTDAPFFSEWAVNVFGVGIMLSGVMSLRKSRSYAEGLLAIDRRNDFENTLRVHGLHHNRNNQKAANMAAFIVVP
jgi:hypothetical protein